MLLHAVTLFGNINNHRVYLFPYIMTSAIYLTFQSHGGLPTLHMASAC